MAQYSIMHRGENWVLKSNIANENDVIWGDWDKEIAIEKAKKYLSKGTEIDIYNDEDRFERTVTS